MLYCPSQIVCPLVGVCTAWFNDQKFCILPTQCIYVFCVDFRTNSDYFPMYCIIHMIQCSSFSLVTRLWVEQTRVQFLAEARNFSFLKASRLAQGPSATYSVGTQRSLLLSQAARV